uniref:E3 ubiquitin-protein ligase RNF14 n=1 Tax=Cyprinus carpio TaxID=7962 RepID=A0A8C2FER6_CYPCA
MSADQEAQEDELLALASIYDKDEFRRAESGKEGEIHLCLELPPSFKLLVKGETL